VRPSQLLDPADRVRLEAAVLEAERDTAGEIVVVVARASDSYEAVGWRLGVALAALAFLALALFAPPVPYSLMLAAQATALLLGHALARIEPVLRWLLPDSTRSECVAERARRAFAEQGLQRTAGRSGILIFVSLLEHRVVVLADEGIHRALSPGESWDEVVQLILRGLREDRAVDGLIEGVRRCGEILAAHLPAPPRDPDELPNAVVLED
jgi:putative membrane protein